MSIRIQFVVQYRICHGVTFDLLTILFVTFDPADNEHLLLLVGRYVPAKVNRARNKNKPWFDDQCPRSFGLKQEAHLWWTRDRSLVKWEEFVRCQVRANETYSEAKRQFSVRNLEGLINALSLHKWWSTLKSAVFGF